MSDFIEREVVLNWMYELIEARQAWTSDARGEIQGLNAAVCAIEDIPAADVTPVRHGRWVLTTQPLGWRDEDCAECSECGEDFVLDEWGIDDVKDAMRYCPNCGARMEES